MSLHNMLSLHRCKNEALKKLHLKSTNKCFKEVKIEVTEFILRISPMIDCCVRINGEPDHLFSGNIH